MTRRPIKTTIASKRRTFASHAALKAAKDAHSAGRPEYPGGVNPTQPKRYE
jgi:hypothetical protein